MKKLTKIKNLSQIILLTIFSAKAWGAELQVPGKIYPFSVVPIVTNAAGVLINELSEHGDEVQEEEAIFQYRIVNDLDAKTVVIKAPEKGTLLKNNISIGQNLPRGENLAYLIKDKRFSVYATLSENELALLDNKKHRICVVLASSCIPMIEKTRVVNVDFPSLKNVKFEVYCNEIKRCVQQISLGSPVTLRLKEKPSA